jgi:FMN phosphatase YigB (HAD superfamily)
LPITTILSDLGNVVVFFDNAKADAAIAALTGRTAAQVRKAVFRPRGICRRYCRGDLSTSEFLRVICARLNVPKRDMPSEDDLGAAFADVFTPNEPVIERWAALRKAGIALTAVSNIEELRRKQLDRMGILSLFDRLVMSYEERLVKPSEELMVRSLDRSGCAAEEALFVDDLAENLPPAAALGIRTHHFTGVDGLDAVLEDAGLAGLIA